MIVISININTYSTDDNAFSISSSKVTGFFSMSQKHVHEKYEIYYLASGERYYFIKDRVFRIRRGHLVFINQGELHKTTDADLPDHQRILVYFENKFLETINGSVEALLNFLTQKNFSVIELSLKEQAEIESIFKEMNEEILKKAVGFEVSLQGLLMKLLVFIARHSHEYNEKKYLSDCPRHEKVSDIVKYINLHYNEQLSVSGIAEHFYISQYYLCRTFKETTGYTLVQYINSVRVKEAQKLLEQDRLKIMKIAEKAGFGSVAQFNRVFRDISGCSPLNYRKSVFKRTTT
jgi:AraC-like DNA-binding protein